MSITGELVKLAHDEGVACGIAIACGIVWNEFGHEVAVEEVLGATCLTTRRKMQALGVDKYDLDRLAAAFARLKERHAPSRRAPRRRLPDPPKPAP